MTGVTNHLVGGARRRVLLASGFAMLGLGLGSSDAWAETRFASPGGSGPEPCEQSAPCHISDALDPNELADGDEIVVEPGVYRYDDPFKIEKAVHIRGRRGEATFLNGRTSGLTVLNAGARLSDLRVSGVWSMGRSDRVVAADCTLLPPAKLSDSICGGIILGGLPTGETEISISHSTIGPGVPEHEAGIFVSLLPAFHLDVDIDNTVIDADGADLLVPTSGYTNIQLENSVYDRVEKPGAYYNYPTYVTPPGEGTNKTFAPQFADRAAGDMRQRPGSPTVDAGAARSTQGLFDFEGQSRSMGDGTDIGADEYRAGDDLDGPAAFAPVDPQPGAFSNGTLEWEASDGASLYELTVDGKVLKADIQPSGDEIESYRLARAYPFDTEGSTHTWEVVAVDDVGGRTLITSGQGPSPYEFRIDHDAPSAPVPTSPKGAVGAAQTFWWAKSSDYGSGMDSYELFVDGTLRKTVTAESCASSCSAQLDLAIDRGAHTWRVDAIDKSGKRTASTEASFTVEDQSPPSVTITRGPSGIRVERQATFEFSPVKSDRTICRVDEAAWQPCATQFEVTNLPLGSHTFQVWVENQHGYTYAERSWQVANNLTLAVSATPAAVLPAEQVRLQTTVSNLAAGETVQWTQWDTDGDGRFDTTHGTDRQEVSFDRPGDRTLSARITTSAGRTAVAEAVVHVRPTPPKSEPVIEIERGDLYTRSRQVRLTLSWPRLATGMNLANGTVADPGSPTALTPLAEWLLPDSDGPHAVSVMFTGMPSGPAVHRSDQITLDRANPTISSATYKRRRDGTGLMVIGASDATSGVASVTLTRAGQAGSTTLPYQRRLRLPKGRPVKTVRVTDAAGNVSDPARVDRIGR